MLVRDWNYICLSMILYGRSQPSKDDWEKQIVLNFLNRAQIITGEASCRQRRTGQGFQSKWRCLYFFVVKPFYQRSLDGEKGSADDFLNGETVGNPKPCFCCLLPALQPHSFPPLSHFQEHLFTLFPLLVAGNVHPQYTAWYETWNPQHGPPLYTECMW